ncbi:MAG: N-acetyltransferase [Candidatus Solibacter usitatus]|nr:N-acetyltransferase [Candidatus Solibacter usitatus]
MSLSTGGDLTDLRYLRSADLEPLLQEETGLWRQRFDWDFQSSAGLVRRFVDQRALDGFALLERGRPVGYSYTVQDEHKGLLGDLYVSRAHWSLDREDRLLGATVEALMRTPWVRRIETQLMTLGPVHGRALPAGRCLRLFERNFMQYDLALPPLRERPASLTRVEVEPWAERHQEPAARLIPAAYAGHIDSQINDQYRHPEGARRFLHNIVQYPGCGSFFHPGSAMAMDRATGEACALALTSLVAEDIGHITQLCVAPGRRGEGIGYELLRRALEAFRGLGCRKVSLTVTAANRGAVALYERVGFRTVHRFCAFVWEGF